MTVADRVIMVLAVTLLGWLYGHYWGGAGQPGAAVLIYADSAAPRRADLSQDQNLTVRGRLGNSVLEIHEGRIRFIASPCANKACIHHGWLGRAGEFAACLPNRVSIQVEESAPAFDAVVF